MEMDTYQDMTATDPQEAQDASFATIAAIYDDGVTLKFDGMDAPTEKHYQTNAFVVFKVGDRVRVIKDSGTYVVEYPVGAPRKSFSADYATNAGSANNASNANYASSAGSASSASSASSAKSATNATNAQYAIYVRSNANSSGYPIRFMVNSNGYFVASSYNGTWKRIDNV